jgi:hypothetical protein
VGKETPGQVFSPSTSGFPCQYHFRRFSVLISHTRRFYQKDNETKSGNLPKSNALSKIMERLIERYFHLLAFEGLMLKTKAGVAADR